MKSIEQAISKQEWLNDKGIDSQTQQVIAILQALNEIAEQLANINEVLDHRG